MKRNSLKKIDLRYFVIPLLILILIYSALAYWTINHRINQNERYFEQMAIRMSDNYSRNLINLQTAHATISALLDDKLVTASRAILQSGRYQDSQALSESAKLFGLDVIYAYNDQGVITHSSDGQYIGWTAYAGHPVHDFMISDETLLVEEIRPDSVSGVFFKYAYVQAEDGTFIQIGILANHIQRFLQRFEMQTIIEYLAQRDETLYVSFIDVNRRIIASSRHEFVNFQIVDETYLQLLASEEMELIRFVFEGESAYQVTGFEALSRLTVKDLGPISPLEFIAVAERHQMIYELGLLVLREACQMIRRMMDAGHSAVGIAVNVSGLQLLRDEFITDTTDAAETAGIPLSHLEFEITESVLLVNYELINEKLNQIRDMGMTVSVDDFGTGFSSLARLHELNIDSVKVDRYFVQRIRSPHDENLIISDIISLAHKTGLSVVAEGVEDEHQKLFLERHDCDVIQGYWLSRPLPEEDAISFLRHRRA